MRGMYISRRTLRQQFDPRTSPHKTYLLCELQWSGSGRFWKHWVTNDDENDIHAEELLLEEIFEPRSYSFCEMTWYLSWSPCNDCCYEIQDFLEEHPNVSIDIRAARLYYPDDPHTRRGLRALDSLQRVNIEVMNARDYDYCWETFIPSDLHYDFTSNIFLPAIQRNRSKLKEILRVV